LHATISLHLSFNCARMAPEMYYISRASYLLTYNV